MAESPLTSNRLGAASSPYLRQHADNPVHWQPWDDTALAAARDQDRPILLSIGYSACHWCHVMAHECFEDPAIADQMNHGFINIKVDREERPDLDHIYQTAHQLLVGRGGGWPLTVFLTPDQMPFFAGTYFPAKASQGMPGFGDVMDRITRVWRDHRDESTSRTPISSACWIGWARSRRVLPCPMPACSTPPASSWASASTRPTAGSARRPSSRSP